MNQLMPTRTATEAEAREPVHAVLPVGSFEQHGHHLPLITDTVVAGAITRELEAAYRVFALPPVTISCSHEHQAWPSTVSVSARTLASIVNDVYDSVARSGLRSLTVVSGHGGNYVLSNVVQEASAAGRRMALFPTKDDWKDARRMAGMATSDHEDMHAGELETSIVLYACPELVRDGWQQADWTADDRRDLLTTGVRAYTPSGVIGKPSEASAEKGKAALDSLTGSFARLVTLFERLNNLDCGGRGRDAARAAGCFPVSRRLLGIRETLPNSLSGGFTAAMEPPCSAAQGDRAMRLGINLCFADNRLIEPEVWAEFVRCDLGLDTVQFTFDLLDPWWPEIHRSALVRRIRAAADAWDLVIDSACVGRGHSGPAGLLDPDPAARSIARRWWRRACDVAAELGATAVGGPLGTLTFREAADPAARGDRCRELLDSIEAITGYAAGAGLREFLIEPSPRAREYPSTLGQCLELADGLRGRCPIPAGFTLEIGQALFEPRYGPQASAETWINALGASILMLRVDNSNRRGDPRWGWPHERGQGLAPIAASVSAAGLEGLPAILEVCPRFGEGAEETRSALVAAVAHCRRYLGIPKPKQVLG